MECDIVLSSFRQALEEVCRIANALKSLGVQPADRVALFMPMVIYIYIYI